MSPAEPDHFDDPALKAAVRRAWGGQTAPLTLRQRVSQTLAAEQAASAIRAQRRWLRRGLAVAALCIVSLGLVGVLYRPSTVRPTATAALPVELASAMIERHTLCCQEGPAHHHVPTARDDFPATATYLYQRLHYPVLAVDVGDPAWQFHGASICAVGSQPSAHLIFARDQQRLSLFSLPATLAPTLRDGETCDLIVDQHPIAGFVEHGGLFCLVGSDPESRLTLQELDGLRSRLRTRPTVAQVLSAGD